MYELWSEGGKDSMKKNLLNRKTYKAVKKMDRQEMEKFVTSIYSQGFKDGTESAEGADFKIKLVHVLTHTKGVGEKTIAKVLQTLKEWEEGEESVKKLAAYKERGKSNES